MHQGEVVGHCAPRHRHQEFLDFLRLLARTYPGQELHLIVDNLSAHKHEHVNRWLRRHPRFHLHFTPTHASWLNLVERWFGELTRRRIRRGSFHSTQELIQAIHEYIQANDENPLPFLWTKKADAILEKVNRCKAVIGTLH